MCPGPDLTPVELMPDHYQDRSRQLGVEFGALNEALETHSYPATVDELVEAYGEYELELSSGSQTFGDALSTCATSSYRSPQEVREEVLAFVDDRAIGRKHYSDRTPPVIGGDEGFQPETL